MSQARLSPMAVQDIDGILEYIARDKPTAAIRFVGTIREACDTLARFPLLGVSREQLAPQLRVFPVGNYVVYCRPEGGSVRIERVLHGACDVDALAW